MKKIKVLHFFKTSIIDNYGGVEQFIDTLCKGTNDLGVENILLTLSKSKYNKNIKIGGYRIYAAKEDLYIFSTGFSISAFFKLKKLANQSDIVHYHFPYPFADILQLLCGIKTSYIITYHSDIVKQKFLFIVYKLFMHKFLENAKYIITTSKNYFNTSKILKKYSQKVSVIPIGIDLSYYPNIDHKLSDLYKKKFKEPFFLFIGALRYYKGLEVALRALQNTNLRLIIAGNGDQKNKLIKLANSLKVRDNVTFLGEISEKEKVSLISLSKCFLFPSNKRSEAFGIALLEAAAFGKPMISCEIGTGTSFVNIHNKTGLVVKPNSPIELRDAMNFILKNPEITKNMSINAKKRFKDLFTANKQSKEYLKIYKSLLKY